MSERDLTVEDIPRDHLYETVPRRAVRRRYVSLSKGRTPLGLPDDLPPGAHPLDWFLVALHDMLGPETAARYLGIEREP